MHLLQVTMDTNSSFFNDSGDGLIARTFQSTRSSTATGLISAEKKYLIEICMNVIVFSLTSCIGVVANTLNLLVYWRQGLKDSITVGFFVLSLSNMAVVILPVVAATCYSFKLTVPQSPVDFPSVYYVTSGWLRNMFYSFSSTLTAVLSIQRCFCVVLPLKVKLIFTHKRSIETIAAVLILHIAAYLPMLVTHQLRWVSAFSGNNSDSGKSVRIRLTVYFLRHREMIEEFSYTALGIIWPTVTQITVTLCVIILIHGLRKSVAFRKSLIAKNQRLETHNQSSQLDLNLHRDKPERPEKDKALRKPSGKHGLEANTDELNDSKRVFSVPQNSEKPYDVHSQIRQYKKHGDNGIAAEIQTPDSKSTQRKDPKDLSTEDISHSREAKEARLIKTMILLVAILSASNIPLLIVNYAQRFMTEFDIGGTYHNLYALSYAILITLGTTNASVNFLVYYYEYNSTKFRQTLQSLLYKKTKK